MRWRAAWAGIAAVAVFAAVGCGGSSGDGPASTPTSLDDVPHGVSQLPVSPTTRAVTVPCPNGFGECSPSEANRQLQAKADEAAREQQRQQLEREQAQHEEEQRERELQEAQEQQELEQRQQQEQQREQERAQEEQAREQQEEIDRLQQQLDCANGGLGSMCNIYP